MEAKLKALKVADLKEILSKSGTTIGSKANKADLIAKILATPAALKVAGGDKAEAAATEPASAEPAPAAAASTAGAAEVKDDDLLALPDEFDWDGDSPEGKEQTPATTTEAAKPADATPAPAAATTETPAPTPAPAPAPSNDSAPAPATDDATATEAAKTAADEELERRKARAARFGIPLVETSAAKPAGDRGKREKKEKADGAKPASGAAAKGAKKEEKEEEKKAEGGQKKAEGEKKPGGKKDQAKSMRISAKEAAPNDDDAKLAARAARFGISAAPAMAKAGSAAANLDPAEEEKRKKREARFGAPQTAKKAKTEA